MNANTYEIPNWAGKPPTGLHLDVMKDSKMIQKLMIDEKKGYFFGRNRDLCDFVIDHQSCSRVHCALLWHKHLTRPFLVDLGSTHGTFLGSIRLESKKPQPVPIDSEIHFGASKRRYIIRERPQVPAMMEHDHEAEGALLGLPEDESELDNLTEFNTAHNKRVMPVSSSESKSNPLKRKRRHMHVAFTDEEMVINPEDIDPSVGRFRNMVQTTIVPTKKQRLDAAKTHFPQVAEPMAPAGYPYDMASSAAHAASASMDTTFALGGTGSAASSYSAVARLGISMPNLAPEVESAPAELYPMDLASPTGTGPSHPPMEGAPRADQGEPTPAAGDTPSAPAGPRKKKYKKEAWPGKRPSHLLV